jgi:hypothetical protein
MRRSLLFLLLALPALSSLPVRAQNERHFNFHYAFTVKNVSPGERVRVWIPLAHSDVFQDVKVTSKGGDLPLKQVPSRNTETRFCTPRLQKPTKASTSSPWTTPWCGESTWCW